MESGTMKAMIVEKHMTKNGIHCNREEDKTQRDRELHININKLIACCGRSMQQYNCSHRNCTALGLYLGLYFPEKAHGELKAWQELLQGNQKASKGAMETREWRDTGQHDIAWLASQLASGYNVQYFRQRHHVVLRDNIM